MATPQQGSNGAADGNQQSIGTEGESPVDGIAGGHPGGIEPAGDDVNAGGSGVITTGVPVTGEKINPEHEHLPLSKPGV